MAGSPGESTKAVQIDFEIGEGEDELRALAEDIVVRGRAIENARIKSLRKLIDAVQNHPLAKRSLPKERRPDDWEPTHFADVRALTTVDIRGSQIIECNLQQFDVGVGLKCSARFMENAVFKNAVFVGATSFQGACFADVATFDGASFEQIADFINATFSKDADFRGAEFGVAANFSFARFCGVARFDRTKFDEDANFVGSCFERNSWFNTGNFEKTADFNQAVFRGDVGFIGTSFSGQSRFRTARFLGDAGFENTTFAASAGFQETLFRVGCRFEGAKFEAGADFDGAKFEQRAQFARTTFEGRACFDAVNFEHNARFDGASFAGDAQFRRATFAGNARFNGASFAGDARFRRTTFTGNASFDGATFAGSARFDGASFAGSARFGGASFAGDAWFTRGGFAKDARFNRASFTGNASFSRARFAGNGSFGGTRFAGNASFSAASFAGNASFSAASFAGDARFGRASFAGNAWFDRASFAGDARFGRASFAGNVLGDLRACNVASATFSNKSAESKQLADLQSQVKDASTFVPRFRARGRLLAHRMGSLAPSWIKHTFGWKTVRGMGQLSILNRVSLVALIAVPVLVGFWPAVQAFANAYHRSVAQAHAKLKDDLDKIEGLLEPTPLPYTQEIESNIRSKLEDFERTSGEWRRRLDRLLPDDPKVSPTLTLMFLAAVSVTLGLLAYQRSAPDEIKKFDEDAFIDAQHARYPEKASFRDDGLRRAITHLRDIASRRSDRNPHLVRHHGETIWVPPRERLDWFNDLERPKDADEQREDSGKTPAPESPAGEDDSRPEQRPDQNQSEEATPEPAKPERLGIVPGDERRRIVIEEGARAEYWLKSRQSLGWAWLSFLLYMLGVTFLLAVLTLQVYRVCAVTDWSRLLNPFP